MAKKVTDKFIEEEHERLWGEAISAHKEPNLVPMSVVQSINTRLRALYCLQGWDGKSPVGKYLSNYMINPDVVADLVSSAKQESPAQTGKRADRYKVFTDWAKENVGAAMTTEQLTEISGFSYPTTLKFLQDSPHFRKVKKGLWEIRDPQADRISEKNAV